MQGIMQKLKNPVSTCLEKMREEDLKKGLIKGAILSVIIPIISAIISVITTYVKYSDYYDFYEGAEKTEKIMEEIKDLEIFSGLFQSIIAVAIVIAVIALILFVIAKMVKSPKKYEEMLSIVNNTTIILIIGNVLQSIVSMIYLPLGILVMVATSVYAVFTLINTFRESLEVEDSDALVVATTIVITAAIAIIMVVIAAMLGESLEDLSDILDMISYM